MPDQPHDSPEPDGEHRPPYEPPEVEDLPPDQTAATAPLQQFTVC
jgi:hypothetical protein